MTSTTRNKPAPLPPFVVDSERFFVTIRGFEHGAKLGVYRSLATIGFDMICPESPLTRFSTVGLNLSKAFSGLALNASRVSRVTQRCKLQPVSADQGIVISPHHVARFMSSKWGIEQLARGDGELMAVVLDSLVYARVSAAESDGVDVLDKGVESMRPLNALLSLLRAVHKSCKSIKGYNAANNDYEGEGENGMEWEDINSEDSEGSDGEGGPSESLTRLCMFPSFCPDTNEEDRRVANTIIWTLKALCRLGVGGKVHDLMDPARPLAHRSFCEAPQAFKIAKGALGGFPLV